MPNPIFAFKYEFKGKITELKTPGSILNSENDKKVDGMLLWDTGATTSCINSKIISILDLKIKGITKIHTANGVAFAKRY